jgi:predicted acylesterase/phospholipase RssA
MFTSIVFGAALLNAPLYIGAYKYLYENGYHKTLRNIYGCSSGAMIGFLIALRLSPAEIVNTMNTGLKTITIPKLTASRLWNMWKLKGFLPADMRRRVLIAGLKLKYPDIDDIDFSTLAKLTGTNLVVCGLNLSKGCEEHFCVDSHPNMSVLHAIDISTTLPFVFPSIKYINDIYVDGGVSNVVPSDIVKDCQMSTLVLYIPGIYKDIQFKSIVDLVGNMVRAIMHLKMNTNITRFKHTLAIVPPDNLCMTLFDMMQDKKFQFAISTESVNTMIDVGYNSLKQYIETLTNTNLQQE